MKCIVLFYSVVHDVDDPNIPNCHETCKTDQQCESVLTDSDNEDIEPNENNDISKNLIFKNYFKR